MKKLCFAFFLTTVVGVFVSAQVDKMPIFISGTEGHKTYRIPAIIQTPSGHLLAFCEGRVTGGGDFGDINIVLKRSIETLYILQ